MTKTSAIRFWKDPEERILNRSLFAEDAESWAKRFNRAGRGKNKPSQLRRFYDEVQRQFSQVQSGGTSEQEFENILAYLHLLVARATYAKGRKLVSDDFVKFLRGCTEQLKRSEDIRVYADFFEAVMAYYKQLRPKD